MSNIKFNNITNQILLSTISGNTLVLEDSGGSSWMPTGAINYWTLSDDENYVGGTTYEFTDSISGLVLKAGGHVGTSGVSFSTDHNSNSNSSIWGNYTSQYFAGPNHLHSTTNHNMPTGNASMSIACWIYDPSPNSYNSECWWGYGSSGSGTCILRNGAGATIGVEAVGTALTNSPSVSFGSWAHYIYTHDSATNSNVLYRNNISIATGTQSQNIGTGPFVVFGSEGLYDNWPTPNGYISQLITFNKVLDTTERQNIMDNT